MRSGICPHCNSLVVEVDKRKYNGEWVHEYCKRQKALKLYNKYQPEILGEFDKNIKYGTKANMAFRYGLNIETKDRKGNKQIKQYAVDFNGTKELINL